MSSSSQLLIDHYAILEILPTASHQEIKNSYRRLARTHHPDKNPSPEATTITQKLNTAYETLSDTSKRAAYDREHTVSAAFSSFTPSTEQEAERNGESFWCSPSDNSRAWTNEESAEFLAKTKKWFEDNVDHDRLVWLQGKGDKASEKHSEGDDDENGGVSLEENDDDNDENGEVPVDGNENERSEWPE